MGAGDPAPLSAVEEDPGAEVVPGGGEVPDAGVVADVDDDPGGAELVDVVDAWLLVAVVVVGCVVVRVVLVVGLDGGGVWLLVV